MFLASVPVNSRSTFVENDEVYVYDTQDLTYEKISFDTLRNLLQYKDFDAYIGSSLFTGLEMTSLEYIYNRGSLAYFVKAWRSRHDKTRVSFGKVRNFRDKWEFGDYELKLQVPFLAYNTVTLYINDIKIAELGASVLNVHYTFFFKEYLIIRLMSDFRSNLFYSVALKENSDVASVWESKSGCIYGDEKLAAKVELLCGVI